MCVFYRCGKDSHAKAQRRKEREGVKGKIVTRRRKENREGGGDTWLILLSLLIGAPDQVPVNALGASLCSWWLDTLFSLLE